MSTATQDASAEDTVQQLPLGKALDEIFLMDGTWSYTTETSLNMYLGTDSLNQDDLAASKLTTLRIHATPMIVAYRNADGEMGANERIAILTIDHRQYPIYAKPFADIDGDDTFPA